jgi:uncharacterized protein YbdZ (MbtH family)
VAVGGYEVELRGFFTRIDQLRRRQSSVDDVTTDVPSGLNWFVWRVVTHERSPASGLHEVEQHWSLTDLLNAHLALDVHDELQRLARERAQRT